MGYKTLMPSLNNPISSRKLLPFKECTTFQISMISLGFNTETYEPMLEYSYYNSEYVVPFD